MCAVSADAPEFEKRYESLDPPENLASGVSRGSHQVSLYRPMDLLPEEAYYWNYAEHLNIGYLDHPPMVGWLIYISQTVFGKGEFAVRFAAFLGWFFLAFFMYRFSRNLINGATASLTVLLLAVLPIYMSVGFLMTPDAPFYIAWAGCLFFLERALLAGRTSAWFHLIVCLSALMPMP